MGHGMGMYDDNADKHGGKGGPCDGTGFMSYGKHPDVWSNCSKADFLAHYNGIVASNGWSWCLDSKLINLIILNSFILFN